MRQAIWQRSDSLLDSGRTFRGEQTIRIKSHSVYISYKRRGTENPEFWCRCDISGEGSRFTPLHYACWENQEEIVELLLEKEEERWPRAKGKDCRKITAENTPSYNRQDKDGDEPVFWTVSARIVEMLLSFADLSTVSGNGQQPLLWSCSKAGIVSGRIASDERLKEQLLWSYRDTLPLAKGKDKRGREQPVSCIYK